MDAREALRRYLEQRRDLGDRELVLDDLPVEDVLRMVGAMPRHDARPAAPTAATTPSSAPAADDRPRAIPSTREEREAALPDTADWREVLRAAEPVAAAPAALPAAARAEESVDSAAPPEPPIGVPVDDASSESAEAALKRGRRPVADDDVNGDPPARRGTRREDGESPPPSPRRGAATSAEAEKAPARPARAGQSTANASGSANGIDAPEGIVVGASGSGLFAGPMEELRSLDEIAKVVAGCGRCRLYKTAINPVPGEGNPNADLVCVGEAPGANEDETGRPFVGAAGQLLTKILGAIDLAREDVFICNVLKHRPPGNRNPAPDEVKACSPYLVRQLELIRPKVIVAFGTFAAQTLLDTKLAIGKLRGSVHRYYGIPLVVTYHPAALLRNPAWKRPTWEDVQLARRILDRTSGT